MSAFPGKVRVLGVITLGEIMDESIINAIRESVDQDFTSDPDEPVLVCDFIQARDPSWVRTPFFAAFDTGAVWFDQLRPAFGKEEFYFESGEDRDQSLPLYSLTESLLD